MSTRPILLVDDDTKILRVLTLRLETEGYEVVVADSADSALQRIRDARPRLVLADLRMPDVDGIELLNRIQAREPGLPVVILSAHGDVPETVRAMQAGAVDFLTKPIDRDRLLECLHDHLDRHDAPPVQRNWAEGLVTRSPQMDAVLDDASRVARTNAAVLITGASGSGKELLARAIHRASTRSGRPFIAINCTAVPAELLESELFGHRRGAFTGAHADHPGLFRAADGGTIFLDEIGDMPTELQAKLLRVLQEREIRPVGETRTTAVDVRVISATHCDLEARMQAGAFREDLFYRLNVVRLRLPPLDARREDIPLLVVNRLCELAARGGSRHVFSPEALNLLVSAPWPGNVRQLLNVVEQSVALAPGRVIGAALVRRCLGETPSNPQSFDEARAEFTRAYLVQLLDVASGNVSQAARLAGRNRSDFYKLLGRYGIDTTTHKRRVDGDAAHGSVITLSAQGGLGA
ncbi:MAG: sigma 54-interacting transcriptional regulator [Nevskia sp.]|jgi:two-component system response regulator GlrR|nr:sigma 54-interacting transcriptional regulator [Nevskia sp.]